MAEQKRKEPTFYRVLHRTDKFNPGEHIELERSVEFDRWNVDRSDLAELVKLPLQELQAKRKDGATAEKTIFGKVQVAAEEWVEQAAQTMLLDRAIEYVKTPEVKHTSNEWKRQKDGVWEISNRVYIMRYKNNAGDDGQSPRPVACDLGHRHQPPAPALYGKILLFRRCYGSGDKEEILQRRGRRTELYPRPL